MDLKTAFLGTPEFAVPSLERVVAAGWEVATVLTQPDRPKGRGRKVVAPPVKQTALRLGLPVFQPENIKRPEVAEFLRELGVEVMVCVAYGKIIPQSIIDIPPLGIVNVHASLLPDYRGAAPIQWAIANGENHTGVTTMLIDAGLDSGDVLLGQQTEIGPEETAPELSERLALLGAGLLVETLRGLKQGAITPKKQDHDRATFAPMLKKEDGLIDWRWPAVKIHSRLRGFQPWPGAYTSFRGRSLHVWKARIAAESVPGHPGTLHPLRRRLVAACGEGSALELLEVQLEGRNRISAEAFVNGQHVAHNEMFGEGGK